MYELEHDAQFLPLGIYTPEVDYTNTAVQVCAQRGVIHAPQQQQEVEPTQSDAKPNTDVTTNNEISQNRSAGSVVCL